MTDEHEIAEALLSIEAVLLRPDEPFEWSSGLQAPIYCDNRLTMAYPDVRRLISQRFARIVRRNDWTPDVIVGTATAGIPHAAWLADRLDLPMAYVRGNTKRHGRQNKVEGKVDARDRTVIVEDLISTGGSVLDVAQTVRAAGAVVVGVVAIFSYGFEEADRRFREAGAAYTALTTFDTLVAQGTQRGDLSPEAAERLRAWREDPHQWSESAAS